MFGLVRRSTADREVAVAENEARFVGRVKERREIIVGIRRVVKGVALDTSDGPLSSTQTVVSSVQNAVRESSQWVVDAVVKAFGTVAEPEMLVGYPDIERWVRRLLDMRDRILRVRIYNAIAGSIGGTMLPAPDERNHSDATVQEIVDLARPPDVREAIENATENGVDFGALSERVRIAMVVCTLLGIDPPVVSSMLEGDDLPSFTSEQFDSWFLEFVARGDLTVAPRGIMGSVDPREPSVKVITVQPQALRAIREIANDSNNWARSSAAKKTVTALRKAGAIADAALDIDYWANPLNDADAWNPGDVTVTDLDRNEFGHIAR